MNRQFKNYIKLLFKNSYIRGYLNPIGLHVGFAQFISLVLILLFLPSVFTFFFLSNFCGDLRKSWLK